MSGLSRTFFAWAASALRFIAHVLFFAPNSVMTAAAWCEARAARSAQSTGEQP